MRKQIKTVRTAFLAAAVLTALAFGAAQAFAGPECSPGVPPNTCLPDCDMICQEAGYPDGGMCLPQNCCQCVER